MRKLGKVIRFYVICCVSIFIYTWICNRFIYSDRLEYGLALCVIFWCPLYTVYIALIHFFKINNQILGKLYYEVIVSILPLLLFEFYDYIAYQLTDNYFVTTPDGKIISEKWFLDSISSYIAVFVLLSLLLMLLGRKNGENERHIN